MSEIPAHLAATVIMRDGQTCQYCGTKLAWGKWVFEHVIPAAKGGPTALYNLVLACRSCNTRKSQSVWIPRNLDRLTASYPQWRGDIIQEVGNCTRMPEGIDPGWTVCGTEWARRAYDHLRYYAAREEYPFREMLRDAVESYLVAEGQLPDGADNSLQSALLFVRAAATEAPRFPRYPADRRAGALETARQLRDELDALIADLDQAEQAA